MSRPSVAYDFPGDSFPLRILAIGHDGRVVWQELVENPPVVIEVPGMPGVVERVLVLYADGTWAESREEEAE